MPREYSNTVARLVVDRPQFSAVRREQVATWLHERAMDIESPDFNVTYGTFRARIMNPYASNRAWAGLRIGAAGSLSMQTRARIAKWMRSRANHLMNANAVLDGRWFVQEFKLS